MSRASWARLAVVLVVQGCASEAPVTRPSPPLGGAADSRPNILLIVADDLGYTDIGSFGAEIATPNLDELARRGMRLANFHAGPSCAPTRAMLMSGVTNREVGIWGPAAILPDWVVTLPELLRAAGYHTAMAGKWHLGHEAAQSPAARGFDASFALVQAGDNHLGASNFPAQEVAYREHGVPTRPPEAWFSSELYADKLLDYLREHPAEGGPWFAYLSFTAPHWPLQLPPAWIDRYVGRYDEGYDALRIARVARARALGIIRGTLDLDRFTGLAPPWEALDPDARRELSRAMELYAAMVENLDFHVGRLIDYLEATGQLENTVVIFLSDNGASGSDSSFRPTTIPRTDWDNSLANMGRAGSFVAIGRGWAEATTAPYRDVKGSLHEGGTRVPAFVSHGKVAAPGAVDHDYLTVMDLLPTLLDIADAWPPGPRLEGRQLQPVRGRSFWRRVLGDTQPVHDGREPIPWMMTDQQAALVRWPWKIVREPSPDAPETDPLPWRLYRLDDDAGETTNRAATEAEVAAELGALWDAYRAELGSDPGAR